ncbi:MAG: oligosaccharide flippase family protein [Chitinophagales bacterium]
MGTIKKQSIFSAIYVYIGIFIGYINVTLLYPTILGSEGFGFTRFLISTGAILGVFAQLGLSGIVIRFFPFFEDKEGKHNGFLGLSFLVPLVGVALVSLFIVIFKDWVIERFHQPESLDLITRYYLLLIPAFVFTVYYGIIEAYSTSLLKAAVPFFFREVFSRVYSFGLLVVYFLEWVSFEQFMLLFVLEGGFRTIGMMVYLKWLGQLSFKIDWNVFRKPIFKEMMEYGFYTMLSRGSVFIISGLDVIMISTFLGFQYTGIYFAFLAATRLITVPASSITNIAAPLVAKAWKEDDMTLIQNLYEKTAITQLVAGLLLFIGLWANLDNFIFLLERSGESFAVGKYVAVFIGIGNLFNVMTGINGAIIINSKLYRWDMVFVVLLVVLTYFTNYFLIPIYGVVGAALATMITVVLYNGIKLIFVWKNFDMQPFTKKTWITLLIGGLILLLNFQLPYAGDFLVNWTNNSLLWMLGDLVYRSAIITVLYGSAVLYFNVSEDMTVMVGNIYRKTVGRILRR